MSIAQVHGFHGNLKTPLLGRPPGAFLPEEPELARVPLFFSKRHRLPGHSPHQFTSGNFQTRALLDRQLKKIKRWLLDFMMGMLQSTMYSAG